MRRQAIIAALLIVGVGVVLGATVFRTDIAQATGLAQSVTVDNTATNPVPVREQNLDGGNIRVHEEGIARVSASQAGSWSMRDRDNAALQPYTDEVEVQIPDGEWFSATVGVPVPSGKRLVIEEVSASASAQTGQVPRLSFAAPSSPGDLYYMPMTPAGEESAVRSVFVTNELTRIYLDAGEKFRAILLRSQDSTAGLAIADVRISGYLVDL